MRTALKFDMTRRRKTRAEKAALEKKREVEATAAMAEYEAAKRAERQKTARLKALRLAQKPIAGDKRVTGSKEEVS